MTHPTDEELDALVARLDELPCCHDGPHETSARCKSCEKTTADAITALRAQLAEAKAEKEKLGRELNLARYGQPDFSWQVHKEALDEAKKALECVPALPAEIAAKDAEIARLRGEFIEATDENFIWGAMDNVHDAETTLDDYAAAVSRAQRAALKGDTHE